MSSKKTPIKKTISRDNDFEKIIERMERDIAKLKAKNKALLDIVKTTESYLEAISKDKTIQEIFQEVLDNTDINVENKCPKCQSKGMKKINLGYVKIISCSCGYRNRINESGAS